MHYLWLWRRRERSRMKLIRLNCKKILRRVRNMNRKLLKLERHQLKRNYKTRALGYFHHLDSQLEELLEVHCLHLRGILELQSLMLGSRKSLQLLPLKKSRKKIAQVSKKI